MTGTSELLRPGEFDDVDMAMMVHATSNPAEGPFGVQGTTNGMVARCLSGSGPRCV